MKLLLMIAILTADLLAENDRFKWEIVQDSSGLFLEFTNSSDVAVVISDPRCFQNGKFRMFYNQSELGSPIVKVDPACIEPLFLANKHSTIRFNIGNELYNRFSLKAGTYEILYESFAPVYIVRDCQLTRETIVSNKKVIEIK